MNIAISEDDVVGPLREALVVAAVAGMSGTLRVTGDPGGTIHLADGRVVGIETPGAPGPEALLLRSRRVSEPGWEAAFAAAAATGGPMEAQLVARQLIGSGELEVLLRTAIADAMFVLASGTVDEYRAEPGPVEFVLPLDPGAEADWLLAETMRRLQILVTLPARHDRDRIVAVSGAEKSQVTLGRDQSEILALADGRRTPRDLAFALGRGVYATLLQLARMHEAGLVVTASYRATLASGGRKASRLVADGKPEPADGLPRRSKNPADLSRRAASWSKNRDLSAPLGLLRPRSRRDVRPGEAP
jgi:uncharacterized protein DUF4388